jgi:hypothetical protein
MSKKSERRKSQISTELQQSRKPIKHILLGIKKILRKIPLLWKIFLAVVVVLGLPNTYNFYNSRLSIAPSLKFDLADPLKDTFLMTNEGNFSIYDINLSYSLKNVQYSNDCSAGDNAVESNISIKELLSHESETIILPQTAIVLMKNSVQYADVYFNVSFRPSFWPFCKTQSLRFSTIKDAYGILVWTHRPVNF